MNYSEMTDFEINKAVGSAIGINWSNLDSNYHALSIWDDGELCVFEPCNSWADAGPIIERERITLDSDIDAWFARDDNCCHTHENPLRAAMIVFLMMQEGE